MLSLRRAPVPRSAGTEARAKIVPASTPENSLGRCGWPEGIDAARKFRRVAVAAPLPDVAEHVVQPPGVAAVAADGCRFPQERPLGSTVVRTRTVEVRLGASQAVAERRGGICPGAAGTGALFGVGFSSDPLEFPHPPGIPRLLKFPHPGWHKSRHFRYYHM